ncbi:hypothetical protein nbrc107696_33830 [Gordonia spumicola]|uniref:Uncharacterized protein n=1 Tax=Gordonia spumicola TaxID=589161 RepID=A0A7I9VCA9_9ACTN|nr:hypothetical protein [Gordonia spumicola]GEE02937.1 hypothetical protein nbrc107696_33830 [Gordonia spumicola]
MTDLGMFPLPLAGDIVAPDPAHDDLAPAIETLLGLGAAVRRRRAAFAVIDDSQPRRTSPRIVDVR